MPERPVFYIPDIVFHPFYSSPSIKRIEHDIWYIENWSFWLDIQIILITIWQMIKGDTKGI